MGRTSRGRWGGSGGGGGGGGGGAAAAGGRARAAAARICHRGVRERGKRERESARDGDGKETTGGSLEEIRFGYFLFCPFCFLIIIEHTNI